MPIEDVQASIHKHYSKICLYPISYISNLGKPTLLQKHNYNGDPYIKNPFSFNFHTVTLIFLKIMLENFNNAIEQCYMVLKTIL